MEESASLRPLVAPIIAKQLPLARDNVAASLADYGETPRVDVGALEYGIDEVLGEWMP